MPKVVVGGEDVITSSTLVRLDLSTIQIFAFEDDYCLTVNVNFIGPDEKESIKLRPDTERLGAVLSIDLMYVGGKHSGNPSPLVFAESDESKKSFYINFVLSMVGNDNLKSFLFSYTVAARDIL